MQAVKTLSLCSEYRDASVRLEIQVANSHISRQKLVFLRGKSPIGIHIKERWASDENGYRSKREIGEDLIFWALFGRRKKRRYREGRWGGGREEWERREWGWFSNEDINGAKARHRILRFNYLTADITHVYDSILAAPFALAWQDVLSLLFQN